MIAFSPVMFGQEGSFMINGVVNNSEDGIPVPQVSVQVLNTTRGTVTNAQGQYSIRVSVGDSLEFSHVSFERAFHLVSGRDEISISLVPVVSAENEIVVVGFGTQRKVNITGSVSTISASELENRPVQNVSQAIQGKVPGLNLSVNSAGGELNNTMNLNIRGGGTIGSGSRGRVLVLIDGVEGDMNTLNPNDIESFSVLKDAASTSIYGSRAPFGVILITTKKGKAGRASLNYSGNFRWNDPLLVPKMLDSKNFAEYWNYSRRNAGEGDFFNKEILEKIDKYQKGEIVNETEIADPTNPNSGWLMYNGYSNNDWFDVFYKNWVPSQEHNLSMSGGTDKMNYYLSGNYLGQNGLLNFSNDKYDRYSLNAKIGATLSSWAIVNFNTRFERTDYNRSSYQTGLFYHNIARRWPVLYKIAPPVEGHPWNLPYPNYGDGNEILQLLEGGRDITQTDRLTQQIQFIFTPMKGWNIYTEGNYRTIGSRNDWQVLPAYWQNANGKIDYLDFDGGGTSYFPGMTRSYASSSRTNFFNANIYSDYSFTIADAHDIKMMAGFQSELNQYTWHSSRGDNLLSVVNPTINNTSTLPSVGGSNSDWATAGFFGRLNYSYLSRYLFEANLRYDGSSRFRSNQRWDLYPSFSAGWNIANEEFWSNLRSTVNVLRLRASWGRLGNQYTDSEYPTYTNISVGKDYPWLINGVKMPYFANAAGLVSQLLTWETIESWNLGLNFGLFNNRLTGSFDVYNRFTYNMVGPAPTLPATLGTGVPRVNNADLKSYGWELELAWRDQLDNGMNYGINFNLSDGKRKILRYPNPTNSINDWYADEVVGNIWGYTTVGIAKTQEEMDNHLASLPKGGQSSIATVWQVGDIMYKDINGDGKIDGGASVLGNTGDRTIIGNNTPRYNFGLNLDWGWKGIDLIVFLQGTMKRDYWVSGPYFWGASGGMWQSAGFREHLDFFRPANETSALGPNVNGYYPTPRWNTGQNQLVQTRYLQNAAYVRLKNIQIGYSLPDNLINKIGLNRFRIYASAENMFTFTKMSKIFDPETIAGGWGDGKVYPLSKIISIGLNVTF